MSAYYHYRRPPEQVTRGARRPRSPEPIPTTVKNTTKAAPTRSIKKTKLDEPYNLASTTLPPLPPNYEPRTLINPILDQNVILSMSGRVREYLHILKNEDATKNLDLDQLIHELDSTSNFLKNLTHRQVEQWLQTSPIEVPPLLRTPKPARSMHKLPRPTPQSAPPPQKWKSFAAAVAGKTQPTAPHQRQTNTKPNPAHPQSRRADSKRFVIDLHSCAPRQLPIHELQDAMNSIAECTSARVAAVKYTDNGNPAVSVTPAHAAAELTSPSQWLQISNYVHNNLLQREPSEPVSIYPDSPWHRAVIDGIPIPESLDGRMTSEIMDGILADWDKYNPVAVLLPRYTKKRIRILAPAGKVFGASDSLSICLAFPEAKHAHRLMREGAFIHSTHCRTSIYKPKHS